MDFTIHVRMMAAIYGRCLRDTLKAIPRYWAVGLTLPFYVALSRLVIFFTSGMPSLLAGLFIGLATDAIVSSFLVMVHAIVNGNKINLEEFKKSFLTYFFDVMGVFFLFWVFSFFVSPIVSRISPFLMLLIDLAVLILFNPLPELIYQRGSFGGIDGSVDLFRRAFEFIKDNWIEWYVPNLVLLLLFYRVGIRLNFDFAWQSILSVIFYIYFVYAVMVFRGFLFRELTASSRRSRLFQFRSRGPHA